jgi:hypothetical protein
MALRFIAYLLLRNDSIERNAVTSRMQPFDAAAVLYERIRCRPALTPVSRGALLVGER